MRGRSINRMCLAELRRELMRAKEQRNAHEIQRINEAIKRSERDIEEALDKWPKSRPFKSAMDILINEGKGKLVVREGRVVREIDMVEVLLKMSEMVRSEEEQKERNISRGWHGRFRSEFKELETVTKEEQNLTTGELCDAATVPN